MIKLLENANEIIIINKRIACHYWNTLALDFYQYYLELKWWTIVHTQSYPALACFIELNKSECLL